MSSIIRRTKQVRGDIIDIYGYIHARSPRSADKVLDAIERSPFDRLPICRASADIGIRPTRALTGCG
jgi:hypothetical protein